MLGIVIVIIGLEIEEAFGRIEEVVAVAKLGSKRIVEKLDDAADAKVDVLAALDAEADEEARDV